MPEVCCTRRTSPRNSRHSWRRLAALRSAGNASQNRIGAEGGHFVVRREGHEKRALKRGAFWAVFHFHVMGFCFYIVYLHFFKGKSTSCFHAMHLLLSLVTTKGPEEKRREEKTKSTNFWVRPVGVLAGLPPALLLSNVVNDPLGGTPQKGSRSQPPPRPQVKLPHEDRRVFAFGDRPGVFSVLFFWFQQSSESWVWKGQGFAIFEGFTHAMPCVTYM